MANLLRYKDLFDSFKSDFTELLDQVEVLEAKKTSLEQSGNSLRAKESYLKHAIDKLNEQIETTKSTEDTRQAGVEKKLAQLKADVTLVESHLSNLSEKRQAADQALQEVKDKQDKIMAEHNKRLQAVNADLKDINDRKLKTEADLADIQEKVAKKQIQISDLDAEIETKQAAIKQLDEELASAESHLKQRRNEIEAQVEKLEDERVEAETKLAEVNQQVASGQTKLEGFKAYEAKAKKALEAREAALLEGEQELELAKSRARRSGSVLNNLGQ